MTIERKICFVLLILWLALMFVSHGNHWGWGFTAFFAFAAGERWQDLGTGR